MECADSKASMDNISKNKVSAVGTEKVVTIHGQTCVQPLGQLK